MDLCEVYGKLVNGRKEPLPGIFIFASCVEHAKEVLDTSTGEVLGVGTHPSYSLSDETGSFKIDLIKQKQYRIVIRPIGYDRVVIIPNDDTVNLWTLSGVSINNVITTSTGTTIIGDPNW